MSIILSASVPSNDIDGWRRSLPEWLIKQFRPEESNEEAEEWMSRWRRLPRDQQIRAAEERGWSFANWLYWFQPEQRDWHWWNAKLLNDDALVVTLQVEGDPTPMAAFEWLLQAAGGRDIQRE
jgi:hypothetical protein